MSSPLENTMSQCEIGSCCGSPPPEEAATLGQLSARNSLRMLCCSCTFLRALYCCCTASCGATYKGSDQTEAWHAGREVLQQVTNNLSITQWARTLSLVRCRPLNHQCSSSVLQPKAVTSGAA